MGAAYSQDLRDRILAAYDDGMVTSRIAMLFRVSPAWARRVKQRRRETGETSPRPVGGARVIKIDMARLRELVEQQPDATIPELHRRLNTNCCESAVGAALQRLRLTFKKRRRMRPSRIDPMSQPSERNGSGISLSTKPGD